LRNTPEALPEIVSKSSIEVFERQNVLSKAELESREEIYTHSYVLTANTESKLVSEIARTMILPAALKFAADLTNVEKTKSGGKLRKQVIALADELAESIDDLDKQRDVSKSDTHAQAKHCSDKVLPAMLEVRRISDTLEEIVADEYWPLPSYQELLYLR
jgi:glutamine synthetase